MSKHGDKRVAAATLLRFKIYKVSLDCGDYYVDRNDIVMVDLVHTNNNSSWRVNVCGYCAPKRV
jgi:hypothetical protein